MPGTETNLVKTCLAYLHARGVTCWRANTGAARLPGKGGKPQLVRFGPPGQSDILGWLAPDGRVLAVECKIGKNVPSEDQLEFLRRCNEDGGLGIVAYCLDDMIGKLPEKFRRFMA